MLLLTVLLLSGCATAPDSDWIDTEDQAVEATIAYNEINTETLVDRIRLELIRNVQADRAEYLSLVEQMAVLTVTDYTEDGDSIVAKLTVTAPDMYSVAKAIENDPFTDQASMDASIRQKLEQANTVTKQVALTFQKNGDDWAPMFTPEFIDALYGGLMTYLEEYQATQEVQ